MTNEGSSPGLTARERECLQWVACGKRDGDISEILGIAESTVTQHLKNAAFKLNAVHRAHAVAIAIRRSLIEG